jgi:hypothetical protein
MPSDTLVLTLAIQMRTSVLADIHADWLRQIYQALPSSALQLTEEISPDSTTLTVNRLALTGGSWVPSATALTANAFVPNGNATAFALSSAVTAAPPTTLVPGLALLVSGSEPMLIQSVTPIEGGTSAQIAVTRGVNQTTPDGTTEFPMITPGAHLTGASVALLRYPTPWEMLKTESLLPWANGKVQARGLLSANLQSSVNGSVLFS